MNKMLIGAIVAVVVVGGVSFYAGMTYAKGQASTAAGARGTFAAGQSGGRSGARGGAAGGFATGQILSSSPTNVTIKLQDGSTKIVLIGTSTMVMKTSMGSISDLAAGTNVVVTGSSNSDGSVTAQNIQIRPAGMTGGFGGQRGTAAQ